MSGSSSASDNSVSAGASATADAANSSTSQMIKLMNFEAIASTSPIVAAFACVVDRHTAENANFDPASSNNSYFEGAGSNVEGTYDSGIEVIADELGSGTNPRKRSLQKVSKISKSVKIIKWMVEDADRNGEKVLSFV